MGSEENGAMGSRVLRTTGFLLIFFAASPGSPRPGLAWADGASAPATKSKAKFSKAKWPAKKNRRRSNLAAVAADRAEAQIGRPYKFAGSTPEGFDCSGLVYYSFNKTGFAVPRRVADQRLASIAIESSKVRKGDLLFFNEEGKKASHVGIYLGKGRFVHAPSTGGRVMTAKLNSVYWKKSLNEVRRFRIPVAVAAIHRGHSR
ncbi:MAG: hypothetical protein C5B49_13725 [Bdellovibrio sp.]|nr:MAG: hypothetical protein C5B49_13725 [Bdellovibrio sp.]